MSARRGQPGAAWAWSALGAAGSLSVALAGPRLAADGGGVTWWFHPALSGGAAEALLYAGLVVMCLAWLGLGTCLDRLPPGRLWLVGALWTLPVLLGPALFSRDVYSYLAQGELLHLGLDPYRAAPVVLAQHGQAHLLAAVSLFWRHTTAPYGPLFLALISPISGFAGSHLVAAALLVKLLDLLGVVLLAVFVPRLAGRLGADPLRAGWLAVLSPLVLLQLVSAGHNDGLMAGLMVAGVTLAVEDRPLPAIALCALAATIKLPAAAAIVFVAAAAVRSAPSPAAGRRLLTQAALVAIAVFALVSVASGVDAHWLTSTVFSTPSKVRLAITPATGIGYTIASVLHDLGIAANARSLESACGAVAGLLTVALALALLWRVRAETLVRYLGIVLVAAALGGPAAWPWYLIWGLSLLAACPGPQRSRALALVVTVPVFLIKAGGIALPPLDFSPAVVVIYALLAASAWAAWRPRDDARPPVVRSRRRATRPESLA